MASQPVLDLPIIDAFGPHRNYSNGLRLESAVEPDKLVHTHCCFCGMQCGIQLKVKDNQVIGFEPWEEFPFNQGMLCPKGVKRYLQGAHPDRLLKAYQRDPAAPGGFRALAYEDAIQRVAAEIERIQSTYGPNSFAVFGGASLTTEKAYLMGKFARMALKTCNIDYNGRLCMVSAAAANKKAFGIDRAANPWADILNAKVICVAGANIAECFPILTNYLWQARENGARIIVVDPRITPIARTCDLFLPVKPGRDIALFNGILHLMIEKDWLDHDFIANHTSGFAAVAEHVKEWTPRRTAEVTGIAEASIRKAAEWWGTAKSSFLMHAARHRASHPRRAELPGGDQSGAGVGTHRPRRMRLRHHHRARQWSGGPRAWPKVRSTPRRPRHRKHRTSCSCRQGLGHHAPEELPRGGVDCYEVFRRVDRGEVRGLLSMCFNPLVSLPDSSFIKRMLERLEFFATIDFFMSETGRYADIILPGSLHEEDEGVVASAEGRVIKINAAVDCPGDARQDWRIIQDIAGALGREKGFTFANPREIFEELRVASAGGIADYSGITYEKIDKQMGVFWPCPSNDHPGTPRLFEPGSFNPIAKGKGRLYFPDGKARFLVAPYTPPAEDVDEEFPVILTTGRVVSQYLSGTQTRRIGPLVDQYPEPRIEIHPQLADQHGIKDGDWVRVEGRRGICTLRASVVTTIRPDTIFVPYHWGGGKSINQLTIAAQDPISKIPEYKVCAVRILKQYGPPANALGLEPQQ